MVSKRPLANGADAAHSTVKLLLLGIALCLLQGQEGHAQGQFSSRITRINEDGSSLNINRNSTFYILLGKKVEFNCFCSGYDGSNVEILHNNEQLVSQPCGNPIRLKYVINTTTFFDTGRYICIAHLANGTLLESPLGNMSVIDSSVVQAEPVQYGLYNTPTALNCTTTLDVFQFVIEFSWYRGQGHDGTKLQGRPEFENTHISHEGLYTCEVHISAMGVRIEKPINFTVIVPPKIFHEDEQILNFTGNSRQEIVVPFQSRFMSNTTVTWWKKEVPLTIDSGADIQTTEVSPPNSITMLTFDPTRRSDSGEYRVSVENTNDFIPRLLQFAEVSFTVRVIVRPAKPVVRVTEPFNSVSWELPEGGEDERPDSFTVNLYFAHNRSLAQRISGVTADMTQASLSVVPGMNYSVTIIAHNQDGTTSSDSHQFSTPPGPPSMPDLQVNRLSNSSVELIVRLAYTGGGDIQFLDVSFREIGTNIWIVIGSHNAQSMAEMTWKALVADERFVGIGVEFRVAVRNERGNTSPTVFVIEPLVLPDAPELESISISTNSLMIQVTISDVGTPPILALVVEFNAPEIFTKNFTAAPYLPRRTYNLEVTGLQDNTQYSFTVSSVNYQGRGRATTRYNSTTAKLPPIPSYGIILIAIAAAILIVVLVVILAIVCMLKHRQHRLRKTYKFNHQDNMDPNGKELNAAHALVKRGSNSYVQQNPPRSLPSSRSIHSNSTMTNSTYIPTSPPFSPNGGGASNGPTSILRISNPSPIDSSSHFDRYRCETCSSTTTNSMQSDESDAGIRYTYNISPSPPAEINTPDLRAQSSYSVMTATTRVTGSTDSTRESLTYEANATEV